MASSANSGWKLLRKKLYSRRWSLARGLVQIVALAVFLAAFLAAGRPAATGEWSSWLIQLNPLLMLANLLATRVFLAGALLGLFLLSLSLVFGRAWCGWLCPLGSILDVFGPSRRRRLTSPGSQLPQAMRRVKYLLALAILVAALAGNLTLLVFDPLTIFFRTFGSSLWPALDQAVTALEVALYSLPGLAGPVSTLDAWLKPAIFPMQPLQRQGTALIGAFFVSILALNLFAPRFWCRYLCPLGGLLGALSRPALLRREIGPECKGCAICTRVCPTGTIDPQRGYASDPAECTLCMECVEVCPRSSIRISSGFSLSACQPYDPGRRQALATFGLALAGATVMKADAGVQSANPFLLRPPGSAEDAFLSTCVRCSVCICACPTGALQPAFREAGLQGLWTPILAPRLGYCDYACNRCGQVCPVQAIPPLSLEEKRQQVIGKAYINRERCIAWGEGRDCIVCEEMCPVPDKAIHLEVAAGQPDAAATGVLLPFVDRERCIGCGICEYKCPTPGEAAIRVYTSNESLVWAGLRDVV